MPVRNASNGHSAPFSVWRRFRRSLREVGLWYTCQNIIKTIFPERVLRANTAIIAEFNMRNLPPTAAPEPGMRWANRADTNFFVQAGILHDTLRDHFARGHRIFIFENGGELIGFRIYETNTIDQYQWLRFRLSRDVIWTSEAWVAPAHRGKGLHERIRMSALSELSRSGYVRQFGFIDAANISMLRASLKDCAVVGYISYLRCLGLTLVRVNSKTRLGLWGPHRPLELHSDLFQCDPARPYGLVKPKRIERIVGK